MAETKPPAKDNWFLGFFYALASSVFTTLTFVCVKKLFYISPNHLSLVRNAGVFAGCLPIAIYSAKEIIGPKNDRLILILRACLGATALYLNLVAFRYLPLAEAAIIMSTVPALTTIVAHFYLKETCGCVLVLNLVMTFCGVLISIRLPELLRNRKDEHFDSAYLGGLACAVVCVLLMAFTLVTLRKMKDLHFSVPLMYYGFFGLIGNGVINFATSAVVQPACGWDEVLVLLIGIFGFVGQGAMALAVQVEAVGIATVTRAALDIVVAMILHVIFFNTDIDMYNIIGACVVIASVSMMGFSKWLLTQPEESKTRQRFKYLLR